MGKNEADAFLEVSGQFRLGDLPTEMSHPDSRNLSQLAHDNLPEAYEVFRQIDLAALRVLRDQSKLVGRLARDISKVLRDGGRIFMAGCGATGRLALTVETLCRAGLLAASLRDRVIGFMAGGDAALVRSLEGFEDREDYARQQVEDIGFSEGDIMIGITEGGETPFVISSVETALEKSPCGAWFCFCNPPEKLKAVAERSGRILGNQRVTSLPLLIGPMALSGSTRLQATTVQLAAMLVALECLECPETIGAHLDRWIQVCSNLHYGAMAVFTEAEFTALQAGENIIYQTNDFGLTVLTDTTERSPTFSMNAFENLQSPEHAASLCYLSIPKASNAEAAWNLILGRRPRTLEWPSVVNQAGYAYLMGYDISAAARIHRLEKTKRNPIYFNIENRADGIHLRFGDEALVVALPESMPIRNIALKLLINAHSTLLAGKLNRYEGNWMTWVKPSNLKLIDRAIRYVRQILKSRGQPDPGYESVCYSLFEVRASLALNESIVLRTVDHITQNNA